MEQKRNEDQLIDPNEMENAKEIALRFLAYRDRTSAEVRDHLTGKGIDRAAADAVVGGLVEAKILDDADLCLRLIRYAMERKKGRQRIARELAQKGLPQDLIRDLLEDEYPKEEELAAAKVQAERSLTQKGETGAPTKNDLARVSRRLAAQGFSTDIIYRTISDLTRIYP
jgi:regulatory protein